MGLDMYLMRTKKSNTELNWDSAEEVRYWRKSNYIHNWFVENVQNGVDDCGSYLVSIDKLKELASLCDEVIETRNHELLPPVSGFFFGNTDVNEYYYEDLKETSEDIKTIIYEIEDDPDYVIFYSSSW